jgi:hypothetical protein
MPIKLKTLFIMGLKQTGNMEQAVQWAEEQLTIAEIKKLSGFSKWLQANNFTVGHGNIDARWKEFRAVR